MRGDYKAHRCMHCSRTRGKRLGEAETNPSASACFFFDKVYICSMQKRFFLSILLFLCASVLALGQTDSLRLRFVVRGSVRDAQTGKPMEAVHISVPGRHFATVSNADGDFVIKSDREIQEVECSFVGYRSQRVSAEGGILNVRLRREAVQLTEASIVSGDPQSIVEEAVRRIPDVYARQPELLECFYRETLQKRQRYTYVAEAVARLYKHRYDGAVYRDAAALEKSRLLVSQRRSDTLSVKTQGGPNLAISHDFVKNEILLFNPEDLELYHYEMGMPAYIDGRIQFVIYISPAQDADYALFNGTLYIDRERLTFTRMELSLDMLDPAKVTRSILVSKPLTLRFFPEEVSFVVNYRTTEEGTTRLDYIRSCMRFSCDWRKRLFRTRYTSINELVVTDVREPALPIPRAERFHNTDYLNEKAEAFSDPDFWEGYNIIEASESLEHATGRLRKK